jgi:hypothetical protein
MRGGEPGELLRSPRHEDQANGLVGLGIERDDREVEPGGLGTAPTRLLEGSTLRGIERATRDADPPTRGERGERRRRRLPVREALVGPTPAVEKAGERDEEEDAPGGEAVDRVADPEDGQNGSESRRDPSTCGHVRPPRSIVNLASSV